VKTWFQSLIFQISNLYRYTEREAELEAKRATAAEAAAQKEAELAAEVGGLCTS
jgi:hypothetical protein